MKNQTNIKKLYNKQKELWQKANIDIFGLTNQYTLEKCLDKYWINGTNLLKEKLLTGTLSNQDLMVDNSWGLELGNGSIWLTGLFNLNSVEKKRLVKLPIVTDIGYKINDIEYALRIKAEPNNFLIRKKHGKIRLSIPTKDGKKKYVIFENGKWSDNKDHFNHIHPENYRYLSAIINESVNKNNYIQALEKMPEYDMHSTIYFTYTWSDIVKNLVLFSKKNVDPVTNNTIAYTSLLKKQSYYGDTNKAIDFVIVESKLEELLTTREISYVRKIKGSSYVPAFYFTDTVNLFDIYKTPTSGLAGRNRLLLDDLYIEGSTIKSDKYITNQWEIIFNSRKKQNLSCLSIAPYNYLNDAKRIMMLSKHRTQAVPVIGENSDLTHGVEARILFADIGVYNNGDSIIISESFAKRLETNIFYTFKTRIKHGWEVGDTLTPDDLLLIDYRDRYRKWKDIKVVTVKKNSITISAKDPFMVGDKLSNYHGSKGIVSLILPDDEMPCLIKDASDNMLSGPVDIIVSGLSIYKRKSLGQLVESVTKAIGIDELPINKLLLYKDKIKDFDKKSKFKFKGKTFQAPCGINTIIRLNHDAWTKISMSPNYDKSNKSNLHLAEMETLNLAARGYTNILQETANRDLNHNPSAERDALYAQKTGIMDFKPNNLDRFDQYLKFLGFDVSVEEGFSND